MPYFLDTNILIRVLVPEDPYYQVTQDAIMSLKKRGERLFIVPQNLIELWNVMTRPADKNGLGLSVLAAETEVARLKELFILLPDTEQVYSEWERLVSNHKVKGTKVHDTRLVAFMLVHRLSHILTFNVKDFQRFNQEILPISPREIDKSKQ